MVADSHSILGRYRYSFSQLLNIHGVTDVSQTEINTELLVPGPSVFEFKLAIEKLKGHKSPGVYQIPAELIKAEGRIIRYEIHTLIISILKKEELPEEWWESIIVLVYNKGDNFAKYVQNFIHHPAVKVNSICRGNYWGS